MNNIRRVLLIVLLLTMTAVGCQSSDEADTVENEEVTTSNDTAAATANEQNEEQTIISFAVNGWERGMYEDRIKAFEESHPNIKVELVSTDEIMGNPEVMEINSENDALLQLVQGADVISWYLQPDFVSDGLLLDLAPLMESSDDFDAADYYPGVLEQYQWNGGTWAVPTNASYMLIFYDKDLFDAAGAAYPKIGWSWDDFVASAQATTLRDGNEVTQWGFSNAYMDPTDLVQAQVGPLFDLYSEPPTARLNDPEVVAAYQWIVDLYTKYEVAPYAAQPESEEEYAVYEDVFQLMDEGKVAMWPDSAESYAWMSGERNIGVVPFPVTHSDDHSSPIVSWGGSTLAVSAGTANPQAAWEWIGFLTQQNGDDMFGFAPGAPISLPARRSAAEASGVWDEMDDEVADALRFAVEHGFTAVQTADGGEKIYRIIADVIDEERDMVDVLAEAQQLFDADAASTVAETAKATPIPAFTVAEPPSSQIEEGDVVVNFIVAGGDMTVFREAAKTFHELHPDIVIKVEEPNFYDQEFSVESMVGDADVFQWWSPISSGDELALVLALQPLLAADSDLTEDDFFPAILDQFRVQGQVMGLPAEVQISFLNYNKRLFDAADREYPQAGWTLDDFLETAVALTEGDSEEDKVYGYVPDLYPMGDMMTFMARQDVTLVDESVEPATLKFDDPDTITAVRWYTNLITEYGVQPIFNLSPSGMMGSNPYEDRQALIENDRAAIWKSDQYAVMYDENGEIVGEEMDHTHIGVVPYPVGENGTSGVESVNGYYISAETEVRQAAWEWLKYLTAQESLAAWGMPARISAAKSDAFSQRVGADKAAVMIAAVENSSDMALISDIFSAGNDWLGPAFGIGMENAYNNIIAGDMTVEEALQSAQNKADIYRQCIIENELVDNDNYEKFEPCMKEADLSWGDF